DGRAVPVVDSLEETLHARDEIDAVEGGRVTRDFEIMRDRLLHRMGDRHLRGRRGDVTVLLAARRNQQGRERDRRNAVTTLHHGALVQPDRSPARRFPATAGCSFLPGPASFALDWRGTYIVRMGQIRVGIGGWVYAPWRGTFYPKGHPQAQEL